VIDNDFKTSYNLFSLEIDCFRRFPPIQDVWNWTGEDALICVFFKEDIGDKNDSRTL